jgi:holo-[acyl-carrier protein] synthase
MILGVGVDIVEIERMKLALERTPRMRERLFSEEERWYSEHKARPEIHYALRFAAKEAVLKALGTGFSGMSFKDVEVARDERGKPHAVLHGKAKQTAQELGIVDLQLSLSYTHSTAVASAVAITQEARPAPKKAPSTKEELAREFKELRNLLEELDIKDDSHTESVHSDEQTADKTDADESKLAVTPEDTANQDSNQDSNTIE